MTTLTAPPPARRYRPLLVIVAGVLVMLAVGSGILTGATDPPCKDSASARYADVRDTQARASLARLEPPAPTGIDLEVRIWRMRIEFPWLKALPLSPGRHIVVSIFEAKS